MQNCTIQLKAKRNSTTVVVNTVASEHPDEAGRYSMNVEFGQYSVSLLVEGFPPSYVGDITVYEDSKPGTLNDFLFLEHVTEGDVPPEVLQRFEQMVKEVSRNAAAAQQSAEEVKQHAADVILARERVEKLSGEVQQNAKAVQEGVQHVNGAVEKAKQAANNSATSAAKAELSEEAAESAAVRSEEAAKRAEDIASGVVLEDASTTKKGIVQLCSDTDSDSETLAATPKAVKAVMEDVKELISSSESAMALQSDIYDRTLGRAALPGAFGYGAFYSGTVEFSSHTGLYDLRKWASKTPPGRYAVLQKQTGTYVPIIPGVVFQGEVEIKILVASTSAEHQDNEKIIIFYGINGEVYYNRFKPGSMTGELTGWENMKLLLCKGIYDRTSGHAALPGALGFGALYSKAEIFPSVGGSSSLLAWVKRTGPGRYFVSQNVGDKYNPIINGETFTGELEIKILDEATVSDQDKKDKVVIFYGQQGCVYFNRLIYDGLSSKFTGWENLKNSPKDFVALQQAVSSDPYSSPVVGGLVLASHNIATINSNATVSRGKTFRGSELQPVVLSADSPVNEIRVQSASLFTYPTDTYTLVGSYAALFGEPTTPVNNKRVIAGLFIRIA